jgi:hypothetical protein
MTASRVADLTIEEFRAVVREEMRGLIRETVQQVLEDADLDAELEFKPEIARRLRKFLDEEPEGEPIDDLLNELSADD